MKEIYKELVLLSLPHMEAYYDDLLVHDRKAIEENDAPFLHFTGESGTYIVFLDLPEAYPAKDEYVPYLFGTAERVHMLEQKKIMVECAKKYSRQKLIMYFDGSRLRQITQENAEIIINEYIRGVKYYWSK